MGDYLQLPPYYLLCVLEPTDDGGSYTYLIKETSLCTKILQRSTTNQNRLWGPVPTNHLQNIPTPMAQGTLQKEGEKTKAEDQQVCYETMYARNVCQGLYHKVSPNDCLTLSAIDTPECTGEAPEGLKAEQ